VLVSAPSGRIIEAYAANNTEESIVSPATGEKRERRRNPRTPTQVKAYLSRRGHPRYRGHVRDLSAAGAFVATGPVTIPEQHVVEIDLVMHTGVIARIHRRPAIVVRRSEEGIGLKFF